MVWGEVTGVLNLNYSSELPNDSIITSPNKSRVFSSFYDTNISPLTCFTWTTPLHTLYLKATSYYYKTGCTLIILIHLPSTSCSIGSNKNISVLILCLPLLKWRFGSSSFHPTASMMRAQLLCAEKIWWSCTSNNF